MKLWQRNRRHKNKKDSLNTRSVVYFERNKLNGGKTKLFSNSGFKNKRLTRLLKISKKTLIIILFILIVSITVSLLLQFINTDSKFVSPLPRFKMSENTVSEIDRKLAEELAKQHVEYDSVNTSEGSVFYITLKNGQIVVIAGDKDIASQIATLQFIHNRLTMEGREFKRLDLRFEKPVITLR